MRLPAVGQAYNHTDRRLSAQTCKNWEPEINQETAVVLSLQPHTGYTLFSAGSGEDRGVYEWNGDLYKVTNTTLERIDSDGNRTTIGSIAGAKRCSFAASQSFLVITSSGHSYSYDGSDLVERTGLESPNYTTFLNNQWIDQGLNGRFSVSNAGDPLTTNALSFANAEADGDLLLRPYTFNDVVYMFGSKTIEQWWNSGAGDPPFDRITGGTVQKGILAPDSISNNDRFVYFLGSDKKVYRMSGAQLTPSSTLAMDRYFSSIDNLDEAIGFCYIAKGVNRYRLVLEGVFCFELIEDVGWFEITEGVNERPCNATSYTEACDKMFVGDGGDVLFMNENIATYNNRPMIKERAFGLFSSELFGEAGRYLFLNGETEFKLIGMPYAVDEQSFLMVDFSRDGHVWSNTRRIPLNRNGEYVEEFKTHKLGRFKDYIGRIRISDHSNHSLHWVDSEVLIGD